MIGNAKAQEFVRKHDAGLLEIGPPQRIARWLSIVRRALELAEESKSRQKVRTWQEQLLEDEQ